MQRQTVVVAEDAGDDFEFPLGVFDGLPAAQKTVPRKPLTVSVARAYVLNRESIWPVEAAETPYRRCARRQQMNDRAILDAISKAKLQFGATCNKYSGALTVELIRRALHDEGVDTSPRDVFISGVPIEIDLLIPRQSAPSRDGLLYNAVDVLAILEIKNAGSFGDKTIEAVQTNFQRITNVGPHIRCCYLTLAERKGFKWAVTSRNSGGEAYTLFWYSGSDTNGKYETTGDWDRFLTDMRHLQEAKAQPTAGADGIPPAQP
jgi:hypothetical protein